MSSRSNALVIGPAGDIWDVTVIKELCHVMEHSGWSANIDVLSSNPSVLSTSYELHNIFATRDRKFLWMLVLHVIFSYQDMFFQEPTIYISELNIFRVQLYQIVDLR